MKTPNALNRRHFVQLSTLAASAALLPQRAMAAAVPEPFLPKLPYAYDALAPHIDARTMEIHHSKHHAGYVAGLNAAFAKVPEFKMFEPAELLAEIADVSDESTRTALRNHGGGHWNHSFFWETLTPAAKSGAPSEKLSAAIVAEFGSIDDFKKAFGEAAGKRFGSGWAWLILQDGKLKITSTPNQDNPLMQGIVPDSDFGKPLLGIDVWEHAYYLNYQNRRGDYVGAWWNIINWAEVSKRFEAGA